MFYPPVVICVLCVLIFILFIFPVIIILFLMNCDQTNLGISWHNGIRVSYKKKKETIKK